jgi:hypothetical protein
LEGENKMAVYFGVFALFLCFATLGILLWWQFSLYKDYDKKFGHLFKDNKDLKGNS